MKLLFLTDNFPPEVNAPATRTYEHCKEWVRKGIDVTIITCAPNFPLGKLLNGYKNKIYQIEYIDEIKVIRVWTLIFPNKGKWFRILDYISFSVSSFIAGLFVKTDIIIGTSPQFFTCVSANMLAFFKRKPWIFELRDLWPESIYATGAMKRSFLLRIIEWLELHMYKNASIIVAVTNSFKAKLIEKGISSEKIKVVTNGSNLQKFYNREPDLRLKIDMGLKDKFIFSYIGTHGMAHSLDFIINSISKINNQNIHFLFIGDGAMKEQMILLARENNLSNVTFLDSVDKEEVSRYLSITDVSLVPLKRSETFKKVIPSKIFESAAMGKPVLLGVEGESKEIIEKYQTGLCYIPEDANDFIAKVLEIVDNKVQYFSFVKNASILAKDFDRIKLAEKMLEHIKDVLNVQR